MLLLAVIFLKLVSQVKFPLSNRLSFLNCKVGLFKAVSSKLICLPFFRQTIRCPPETLQYNVIDSFAFLIR